VDFLTIGGILLGLAGIIGGMLLEGGNIASLLQLPAFLIVIGGSLGAGLVQSQKQTFMRALSLLRWVVLPPSLDSQRRIEQLVGWANIARKESVLGLETLIDQQSDGYVRKALQMLVDGTDPEIIRHTLEVDITTQEDLQTESAKLFESIGGYAPTIGIIGAVIGLIRVMQNLTDPEKLGGGIAVAFVATIYGLVLANLIMIPISGKLKSIISQQSLDKEMILEGVLAIANGENPHNIEMKLQSFLEKRQNCMKRRKKGDGEHHGSGLDRWMVSWADFLTLLFAFFVVMYATALTEKGKIDLIADSILRALKMQTPSIVTPIRLSEPPPPVPYKAPVEMPTLPESLFPELGFMPKEPQPGSPEGITEAVMRELEGALAPLIKQGLVEVRRSEYWVEVELKDKVLFPTAKASLDQEAQQLLTHIAQIFAPFPYPIRVEGHTVQCADS